MDRNDRFRKHPDGLSEVPEGGLPALDLARSARLKDELEPYLRKFEDAPIGPLVQSILRAGGREEAASGPATCPVTGAAESTGKKTSIEAALPEVRAITAVIVMKLYSDFEAFVSRASEVPGTVPLLRSPWSRGDMTLKAPDEVSNHPLTGESLFWRTKGLFDDMSSTLNRFFDYGCRFHSNNKEPLPPDEEALVQRFLALPKHENRRDAPSGDRYRVCADLSAGMNTAANVMARLGTLVQEVYERDTGAGISPEELTKIFMNSQRFVRDLATLPLVLFSAVDRALSRPDRQYPGFSLFDPAHFTLAQDDSGLKVELKAGAIAKFHDSIEAEVSKARRDLGQMKVTACPAMHARSAEGPTMTHFARWAADLYARTVLPKPS